MSQRNGQNPVRMEKSYKKESEKFIGNTTGRSGKAPGTTQCPSCGEDVPPKPGFRTLSLKCPKCGKPLRK
jgi:hypothetical protein